MTLKYLLFPFLCCVLSCWVLARLAPGLALLDRPDARKRHEGAVPVVGGIAILLSYLLALKLRGLSGNLVEAILPVGLLLSVGIVDDMRPLSARIKLVAQLVAAWLLLKTTGYSIVHLEPVAAHGTQAVLASWSFPVLLFAIVAIVNAINMADGMDGLAGGYILVALSLFLAVAIQSGQAVTVLLLVGLISAVLGFLACNARHPWMSRAKVFMGDAGALSIGMLICWFAIDLSRGGHPAMSPVLALYAVALPVLDMFTVSLRRALNGRNPMRADRSHLHHLLLMKGWSVELSVPALWAIDAGIALAGFVLWRNGAGDTVLLLIWLGLLVVKMLWMRVWESVDEGTPQRAPEQEG